jgi:hypothetical protein
MTLEQVISRGRDIAVLCHAPSCGAVTPLSPAFFAARLGPQTTLDRLAGRLSCAGCGSKSVSIQEWIDTPSS